MKLHKTGGRRWIEHLNNIVYAYKRTIHVPSIDIDPDMVLAEENAADTQWILELASDVREEFTETVTTTTTIIADELGSDSKIGSDVAKHFKNYRERIIESNNSNKLKRNLSFGDQFLIKKKDFDIYTKTKRAPFDSFYDNLVVTVTAYLLINMIEVKKNDGDTGIVVRGVIKRVQFSLLRLLQGLLLFNYYDQSYNFYSGKTRNIFFGGKFKLKTI
ncbi:hypothetical protein CWI36_1261p0020 [Hamiltosporidium magnivora]|uniref:Uncharacterized protein n=1 Tax=Hamiltosporidium magnivora TaxID=148818 RepID=A0A4Q9L2T7_9MICR|nr:hypothetical protein CWI36_1261p0020 [Hamiltosporidium magnivora]